MRITARAGGNGASLSVPKSLLNRKLPKPGAFLRRILNGVSLPHT